MSLPSVFRRRACRAVYVAAALATGCERSSTSPTSGGSTPVVVRPVVSVVSVATAGDRNATAGFQYRTVVTLRESAGAPAPVSALDLTFVNGSITLTSSHHDRPISDTSNTVAANSTITTRELVTTDDDASHVYATNVQVRVTYADSGTSQATTSAVADVPPLSNQPPATFTLSGVIGDESGRAVAGARVEGLNGANGGKTATTDGGGGYTLNGLVAETFRLRASAAGYDTGEQNVTIPNNARADFTLRRTPAPAPVPAPGPCVYTINPQTIVVSNNPGQFNVTLTRTSGTCGWQASTTASWLTPSAASGSGSATLSVAYQINGAPEARTGVLTVTWDGGSAQLTVTQSRDLMPVCKGALLLISGSSGGLWSVPAAGGTFPAGVAGISEVPGLCTRWSVMASAPGVSFNPSSGSLSNPGESFTITVSPNTSGTERTILITVSVGGLGPGGSATVTLKQGG